VEAGLRRALADVRIAVGDFEAMAALLDQAMAEVGDDEAAGFLRWLREDNFVLLGHRRLMLDGDGAQAATSENLGLLRDASLPVFEALARLPVLDGRVRAALAATHPVTVAKANMRSTVHRPQHADVIATRSAGAMASRQGRGFSWACSRRALITATRAPSRCCAPRSSAS
jgi:glutamate dehydrogenase